MPALSISKEQRNSINTNYYRSGIYIVYMIITSVKDIGLLIKEKRKKINMTQKEAASIAGVGVRFLSELENGKPTLEIDKVLNVARLFGIDIEANNR